MGVIADILKVIESKRIKRVKHKTFKQILAEELKKQENDHFDERAWGKNMDELYKAYELLYDIDVQDNELLEEFCDELVFLGGYEDARSKLEVMSNRI